MLVAAAVIRLLSIWLVGLNDVAFGDATDYISLAHGICDGSSYRETGSVPFMRAPGLPFFLAPLTCFHVPVFMLKVQLALLDTFSVLLIALIAQQLGGSGAIAATIAALYPPFVAQSGDIQSEPLFLFLLLFSVYTLMRGLEASRWRTFSALSLGLAVLTRPVALLLIPYFAVSLAILSPERNTRLKMLIFYLMFALIPILPWSVYNSLRFSELIIISDGAGYNFWRGTHPEQLAILQSADAQEFATRASHFEIVTSPVTAVLVSSRAKTPMERSGVWTEFAWQQAATDPRRFVSVLGRNLINYWRPWLNPVAHSREMVIFSALCMIPILAVGFIGLFYLRLINHALFWFFCVFFLLMWLAHAPFQVVSRFRIPLVDPYLIVLGAAWLESTLTHRLKSSSPQMPIKK